MHIPSSTYRIQFNADFGFAHALRIVPYLAKLGITDLYASPIFRARKGSTHGYDATDHNQLNPELGSRQDFENLCTELKKYNIRWLQDIVPNHMAFDPGNKTLMDVLKEGPASEYHQFFDIKWHNPWPELNEKVLIPILGQPLEQTIKAGQLKLSIENDTLYINYFENRFPLKQQPGQDIRNRLDYLNDPKGSCDLKKLLQDQNFTLAFWKTADEKLNYRGFFHLTSFIALNQQYAQTFHHTHKLLLELIEQGKIHSLRIDHIDGLYDPKQYLNNLSIAADNPYIIVEKILELSEQLPADWPVQGTSGYQFMNYLNNLFCNCKAAEQLEEFYRDFTGRKVQYEDLLYYQKKQFIRDHMKPWLDYFTWKLSKILIESNIHWLEDEQKLRAALEEFFACMGVYRTYITADSMTDTDRLHIAQAVEQAIARNTELTAELELLHSLLTLNTTLIDEQARHELIDLIMQLQQFTPVTMAKGLEDTFMYVYNRFVSLNEVGSSPDQFGLSISKFHDFNIARAKSHPNALNATATHDTKRGEDVRARLNVLSEMPDKWQRKARLWSKMNDQFRKAVDDRRAPDNNKEYLLYQTLVGTYPWQAHDSNYVKRIKDYFLKALREGKVSTSWTEPDDDYEKASMKFIEDILENEEFLTDFHDFQRKIANFGVYNSLSQTLLKITCPGVPDFYRGSELWDLSLVDPDNRRPVDFENLTSYLGQIVDQADLEQTATRLLNRAQDGVIKLLLINRALRARNAHSALFQKGRYIPLKVEGSRKNNIIAFARKFNNKYLLTVAPRFLSSLVEQNQLPLGREVWQDTKVIIEPSGPVIWNDALLGTKIEIRNEGAVSVADIFEKFPYALLISE